MQSLIISSGVFGERNAQSFEMWKLQFWLETLIPWIFVWVDGRYEQYLWVARSLQFSLISVGESLVYFFCTRVVGLCFFCALLMNHLLGYLALFSFQITYSASIKVIIFGVWTIIPFPLLSWNAKMYFVTLQKTSNLKHNFK